MKTKKSATVEITVDASRLEEATNKCIEKIKELAQCMSQLIKLAVEYGLIAETKGEENNGKTDESIENGDVCC